MTAKQFSSLVGQLWLKRGTFIEQRWTGANKSFNYPEYAGLPKKLSNTLSPEAVDALQSIWDEYLGFSPYDGSANGICGFRTKREFARAYYQRLVDLGESLKFTRSQVIK